LHDDIKGHVNGCFFLNTVYIWPGRYMSKLMSKVNLYKHSCKNP